MSIPIEKEALERLLQEALGCKSAIVGEWHSQELKGGFEYGCFIHRLNGAAICDGKPETWSLIVKIIRPGTRGAGPEAYNYWKREALIYQSGFLKDLPGKLAAPRCYAVTEQSDGAIWIWMEDVKDDFQHPWSIEQYARVARALGEFNGAYLTGRSFPTGAWVRRDWLRKYLEHAAPMMEFIRQNPAHPTVKWLFPGIFRLVMLALWDEHPRLLKMLEAMPQTFCHQDAFGRNLFNRGDQLVAIDWGFSGIAPLGSELVPLVGVAFGLAKFPSSQAQDLDRACFSAYLEGLRLAGWQPDPRQVRKVYAISLVLRYLLGATIGEIMPALLDEHIRQQWFEGLNAPAQPSGEADSGTAAYIRTIFFEALNLLGPLAIGRIVVRSMGYAIGWGKRQPGA